MLPQSFDASGMNAQAQVVVQALKTYGGYLVDTDGINGGGGWNFYGEIGSTWGNIAGYTLQSGRNLNLDAIVGSLRAVTSVSGWVDGSIETITRSRRRRGTRCNSCPCADRGLTILAMGQ
jgi:hypothetical protein